MKYDKRISNLEHQLNWRVKESRVERRFCNTPFGKVAAQSRLERLAVEKEISFPIAHACPYPIGSINLGYCIKIEWFPQDVRWSYRCKSSLSRMAMMNRRLEQVAGFKVLENKTLGFNSRLYSDWVYSTKWYSIVLGYDGDIPKTSPDSMIDWVSEMIADGEIKHPSIMWCAKTDESEKHDKILELVLNIPVEELVNTMKDAYHAG